ncbi:hypothetical protein HID58_091630 [Brassica napus]|uniref:Uncharacterized protein n=1 Tax=Brassica napus TaxID=3708 RepID=A0ABQ7WZ54_BRANA|nr:hypothetical protein HID58_091630 [Brassica napus]
MLGFKSLVVALTTLQQEQAKTLFLLDIATQYAMITLITIIVHTSRSSPCSTRG